MTPAREFPSGLRTSKLIVLDRDGVINHDCASFIKSPDEWRPIEGSLEAIAKLNFAGYRVVVATNQSGIDRGLFDMQTLNAIHEKMYQMLSPLGGRIDAVFFCPHSAQAECECRKPKPGLFRAIEQRFHVDLTGVPCVGDSLRDLQAAEAVGGLSVLVRTGKGEKTLADGGLPEHTWIFANLAEVAEALLAMGRGDPAE
ncbi:MAG: D-glycero-beta-D-manno-heptose 1,7-bisphosphate 7-phosphatase [Burkholderiales bacterium]|jgi:D-glycero-D-manno-heptose 1,7-bisphosphate phosphatase|nr:D-glycero-beta-D-manno-heptose 1,7-bisphosphate 7-phosphatase [Burkholderiales bacterium]